MRPVQHYYEYLTQQNVLSPSNRIVEHGDLALGSFHFYSLQADDTDLYKAAASADGVVAPGQRSGDAWHALLTTGEAVEIALRVAWLETDDRIDPQRRHPKLRLLTSAELKEGGIDPMQRAQIAAPTLTHQTDGSVVLTAWFVSDASVEPLRWRVTASQTAPATFEVFSAATLAGKSTDDSVTRARQMLVSSNQQDRLWALEILGEHKVKAALPGITAALGDTHNEVREAAATALGKLGDSSSIDKLREAAAEDPDRLRRSHFVAVLSWFGDPAVHALTELAEVEATVDTRIDIVHALSSIRTPAALAALETRAADDPNDAVRNLAATYLETLR